MQTTKNMLNEAMPSRLNKSDSSLTEKINYQNVTFKLFLYPQELWLKNQILGALLRHYDGENAPTFDEMPIIRLLNTMPSELINDDRELSDLINYILIEPK